MKLKTFTPDIVHVRPKRGTINVRINRKSGVFQFSKLLSTELNLKDFQFVRFHQDEENPKDWFVEFTQSDKGFALKEKTDAGTFTTQSCGMADNILNSLDLKEVAYSFLISKNPIAVTINPTGESIAGGGVIVFAIITKSAKI